MANEPQLGTYVEPDLYDEQNADADDEQYNIEYSETTKRFRHSLHVPKVFRGALIGAKGMVRKRIETDTRTALRIPASGAEGDVEIHGARHEAIVLARRRIDTLVRAARFKTDATHFVCVPVVQEAIKQRYAEFRQRILGWPQLVFGLDESMFMFAEKLHVTVAVMALMDETDRAHAKRVLNECQTRILRPALQANGGSLLAVRLHGVDCMNDDPGAAHVLFARVLDVDGCTVVQDMCNAIRDAFVREGLTRQGRDDTHTSVKMHVTLINSRYRVGDNETVGPEQSSATESANVQHRNRMARHPFDARKILQEFGEYDFGRQTVEEIHLSRRFTASAETGFYDASAVVRVF